MALKLTLKPGERVAVNGAVLVNGDRRSSLVVENRASVLRERDVIKPEDANTPAKRIYVAVMMMALDGKARKGVIAEFDQRLTEFAGVVTDPKTLETCLKLAAKVANKDYHKALSHSRKLIDFEKTRLAHAV